MTSFLVIRIELGLVYLRNLKCDVFKDDFWRICDDLES